MNKKEETKNRIIRLQIELMVNNGYTDSEIEAHKAEARTKPPKKARRTK